MTNTDVALLLSEWVRGSRWAACPVCEGPQPGGGHEKYLARHAVNYKGGHQGDCAMDQALGERGLDTQASRDAARQRIQLARAGTERPPPGSD